MKVRFDVTASRSGVGGLFKLAVIHQSPTELKDRDEGESERSSVAS